MARFNLSIINVLLQHAQVQQRPFTQAKVSSRVLVGMQLFSEEGIEWNAENMRLITSMIEVKPISVSL